MANEEFDGELKQLIEALIFAADHPLSVDKLANVIESAEREDIKKALEELSGDYAEGRGLVLSEVGGGFQLRTRPEHAPWIKRFFKVGLQRISKQAMEAMAIVAYKQPVTRGELEEIRGVDSGGVLKALLDKRLVKIVGKKDVPGRPVVYGTTKEFLEVFDLKGLMDLPTLKDIELLKEDEEEGFQEGLFESRRGGMLTDEEMQAELEVEKLLSEAEAKKEKTSSTNDGDEAQDLEEDDEEGLEESDEDINVELDRVLAESKETLDAASIEQTNKQDEPDEKFDSESEDEDEDEEYKEESDDQSEEKTELEGRQSEPDSQSNQDDQSEPEEDRDNEEESDESQEDNKDDDQRDQNR